MKGKLFEEIKELFSQSINWAKLELEYIKLTAAEKIIVLFSVTILGAVFMLLLLPLIMLLLLALVGVFRQLMSAPLAYLCVGGIVMLIILLVYIFKRQLIVNPVAKFISRLFLEKDHQSHE